MSESCCLVELLPEVQECLSSRFSAVDCCLGLGPDLSRPPFNLPFRNIGQQITYVPDSNVMDDIDRSNQYEISLGPSSFILTDGLEGNVMEITLEEGMDWLSPLSSLFNKMYSLKWTFVVVEVENAKSNFHVISAKGTNSNKSKDGLNGRLTNFTLWIVPVSRIFAVPSQPKKVRIVKKVIKKKSSIEGEGISTESNGGSMKKVVKVTKKKKMDSESDNTPSHSSTPQYNEVNGNDSSLNETNGEMKRNGYENKDIENNHSSHVNEINGNGIKSERNGIIDNGSNTSNTQYKCNKIMDEQSDDEDITLKLRNEIANRERQKNIIEERERSRKTSLIKSPSSSNRMLLPIAEASRRSHSQDPTILGRSGVFMNNLIESSNHIITSSSTKDLSIPFTVLQLVLKNYFTYEELGYLRRVHPHWDELCGQLLNSAYYVLLERTDKLLMKLQRQVIYDSGLHYAVSVLTNIQVHILNPVDIMRAALDEGICCFPYGVIIDRTMTLLDHIERMITNGQQIDCKWEPISILSKKASYHYRSHLESIMEERMGTCARLKAAQRIIRMDSMIVEANVTKLEKESMRARDDLRWEIEQLQQMNSNLKKENRQLKSDHMKLESRVDILEQKLRTISRLLS